MCECKCSNDKPICFKDENPKNDCWVWDTINERWSVINTSDLTDKNIGYRYTHWLPITSIPIPEEIDVW